jgi:peptidoglycan hydrolase-like protein with peptidoglycan-binding domain
MTNQLSLGSNGPQVLALQRQLIELGLIVDPIAINQINGWANSGGKDASYGKKTQDAIKQFQTDIALLQRSGDADQQTLSALQAISTGNASTNTTVVKALQQKLAEQNLTACIELKDKLKLYPGQIGTFGPATTAALEAFQAARQIGNPRGRLGPLTYKALFTANTSTRVPASLNTLNDSYAGDSPAPTLSQLPFSFVSPSLGGSYYESKNQFTKSGLRGECTWYACGRAYELMGKDLEFKNNGVRVYSGRNPKDWSKRLGIAAAALPRTRCIAINSIFPSATGHVAFVEYVDTARNLAYFTEANTFRSHQYCGLWVMDTKTMKDIGWFNADGKFVSRHLYGSPSMRRFNTFLYV